MKSEKIEEVSIAGELELEEVRSRLTSWFARKMPKANGLALSPLKRPGSGTSNMTLFSELRWQQDGEMKVENIVIRCAPRDFLLFPRYDLKEQFSLIKQLGTTAIPVPRTRWFEEDKSVLGVPFYIMDHVPGWYPQDFPPYHVAGRLYEATPEAKAKVWWAAVDVMAKINTLDWERVGLGFLGVPKNGTDALERQIAYYEKALEMNEEPPLPILEVAGKWLRENAFVPKHISLCWGDTRPGNLIYSDDYEVRAVLDWEMTCLGDPESDLAWFIHFDWGMGEGHPYSPSARLEGLPGTKETIDHYERVTGRKVENYFYHEVFACWRLAVMSTRVEKVQKYSKQPPGFLTNSHCGKLRKLLGM